jgi:phosphomannomutase
MAVAVARRRNKGATGMSRRYFGTDGVRGKVGEPPMTVDFALRLASAAARVLAPNGGTVLIGKDTRLSGYMFEAALEAGFTAAGANVLLVGPLPTPAVAYLCRELGAISASSSAPRTTSTTTTASRSSPPAAKS